MWVSVLKTAGKWLFFTVSVLIILFAVLINIARFTFPLLDHQRAFFEQWASHVLRQPVLIGHITAGWHGLDPELTLNNVVIKKPFYHGTALKVAHVSIAIDAWDSLMHWQLLPGHLSISGAQFSVVENKAGRLMIRGVTSARMKEKGNGQSGSVRSVLTWLLTQADVSINHVDVLWHGRDGMLIPVKNLQLKVDNRVMSHRIAGVASLAQTVPTQIQFVVQLHGARLDRAHLNANVYVHAKHFVLAQWSKDQRLDHYLKGFHIAHGQANFKVWARVRQGRVNRITSTVSVRRVGFRSKTTALMVKHLAANVVWQRTVQGWSFAADQLHVRMNGKTWPESRFAYAVSSDPVSHRVHQTLRLGYLQLGDVRALAQTVGYWPKSLRAAYAALSPQGALHNIELDRASGAGEPAAYAFSAQFRQLGFSPWKSIPGVQGLSGAVTANQAGGQVRMRSSHLRFQDATVWSHALRFTHAVVEAHWTRDQKGVLVSADHVDLNDQHVTLQTAFQLSVPKQGHAMLNLLGNFSLAHAARIKRYLPNQKLSPYVVTWLSSAFPHGSVPSGQVMFHGPLFGFPYRDNSGHFEVVAQVRNMTLKFSPTWPAVTGVTGTLKFDNAGMIVNAPRAVMFHNTLTNVQATLPDLHHPVLSISATVRSPLSQALALIKHSPMSLAKEFSAVSMKGMMQLVLQMKLFLHGKKTTADTRGTMQVSDATLGLNAWGLAVSKINGVMTFHNDAVNAHALSGELMHSRIKATIRSDQKGKAVSSINIGVQGKIAIPDLNTHYPSVFWRYLKGKTPYTATVVLNSDAQLGTLVTIQSHLKGVSADLPAPFAKAGGMARPLRVQLKLHPQQPLAIDFYYAHLLNGTLFPRRDGMALRVNSPTIKGFVFVPNAQNKAISARFDRLILPKKPTQKSSKATTLDPRRLPPLELVANDCRYGQTDFGRVTLSTRRTKTGLAINSASVQSKAYTLSVNGWWRVIDHHPYTYLRGDFASNNLGQLLSTLGVTKKLARGKADIHFALNWPGAPNQFKAAGLDGHVRLSVKHGSIVELDKSTERELGLGRLLNLFSLRSLSKRLTLNFKDLTSAGFQFDSMRGTFALDNGLATTHDAVVNGNVAKITVQGAIGFAKKEYDITMTVMPFVTANLPIIVGIAGGPVAGAVAWVVNKVVSPGIARAAGSTYKITGDWDHPHIVKQVRQTRGLVPIEERH